MIEIKSVLLTDSEQEWDVAACKVLRNGLGHCLFNLFSQLKKLAITNHDVDKEIQVRKLRHRALRSTLLSFLEKFIDHVLCLKSTIHSVFKLTIVNESAHNLQDKFELVLAFPTRLVCVVIRLVAALEKACKYLTAPLFRALTL